MGERCSGDHERQGLADREQPGRGWSSNRARDTEREAKKVKNRQKKTTPTVEFRAETTSSRRRPRKQTYSTIESNSYDRRSLHLALKDSSSGGRQERVEFCGWETGNRGSKSSPSAVKRCPVAERSTERCRLLSRAAGGRSRKSYVFRHLLDTSAYLTDYCAHHSFSSLVLSRENGGTEPATTVQETASRGKSGRDTRSCKERAEDGYERCLLKSRGGGERECLQQLASRLGVRESIKDGQLCCHPRPTPPSFTKKNRVAKDIVIYTQDDRCASQAQKESDQRTISLDQQSRPDTSHTPAVELPKLPPDRTISTSSVAKYLTVNSRMTRHSLGLGEEESAAELDSHDSIADAIPEETVESPATNIAGERQGRGYTQAANTAGERQGGGDTQAANTAGERQGGGNTQAANTAGERQGGGYTQAANTAGERQGGGDKQETFISDDVSRRQRVLTRKAQALGLLSRDWTQARLVKKVLSIDQSVTGGVAYSSQPCTRGYSTRPCTRANSRMDTRANSRMDTRACSRMDTRANSRMDTRANSRMDTRANSRMDTRANSRMDTRANSRMDTRANSKMERRTDTLPTRRPYTRADSRPQNQEGTQMRNPNSYGNEESTDYRLRRSEVGKTTSESREKIDSKTSERLSRLQVLYEAKSTTETKRSPSRQQQRVERRPATRCGDGQREKTRPSTRAGKRVHIVECDGSQYWREVPRIGHYGVPPSHSGTKTNLRADSHSREPGDVRAHQRVRLRPQPHPQLKHRSNEARTSSFELSGHLHRHRYTYS